ncbi:MAG: cysteine peptidase family C39 domain-containing protein [Patescibacteria group bacterium]
MVSKGEVKDFASIADLKEQVVKKKIPVIVDWWYWNGGHYSVVVDVDARKISLQDPLIGRMRIVPLRDFERLWFDFREEFVKSKNDLVVRRMIIISR